MNNRMVLWMAVATLVTGCAGLGGNEAPVEDRAAGPAAGKVGEAPIVEAGSAAPAGGAKAAGEDVSTRGLTAAQISEADRQGAAAGAGARTSPLPEQPAQVTAGQPGGAAAGSGGTAGEGPHGGGKGGAASLGPGMDLNDPNGPLAKRKLYFDYDSSAIKDEYRETLEAHSAYLKTKPTSRVLLQGHADERGSREYNLALGQRRAESVFQTFTLLGVPAERMEAVSLGEEKPEAEGHEEAAWRLNRRVEILYQSE